MNDERLVYEHMRTPWGAAQTVKILIDGIGQVNTAGHGGFKLSHERNLKVPLYMRQTSGWYEEDCEVAIPLVVFDTDLRRDGPEWLVELLDKYPPAKTIANYWPDWYERYFKVKLKSEESMVLRERAFKTAHANDYVVVSAFGDWQAGVPKGMVGVYATIGESRQEPAWSNGKWFLVQAEEYRARQGSFAIDSARHQEVSDFTKAVA